MKLYKKFSRNLQWKFPWNIYKPNDSCIFSGIRQKMVCVLTGHLNLGTWTILLNVCQKSLPCMYFINHWTDVKSFFGLHLVLHNNVSRWKLWNLLNLFGRTLWNNDKNNIKNYLYSKFICSYSSLLLIYYIIYKIWRVWCYRSLEIIYGPKWLWAEMVMGRFAYWPIWLWAEMTRNPPEP